MRIASSLLQSSFAVSAVTLAVFACGGTSTGDTFVAITPTTMQALGGSLCNKYAECTSDLLIQVAYGSADACRSRFLQQIQLSAKGTGFGVSEQGGAACNGALGTTSCADVLSDSLPPSCQFTGTLADGTSCTDDAQCVSGSCFIDKTVTCGKCGPRAAVGADCTNANCARGLKCGSAKTCTNGQAGAACTKDEDCRTLTSCRAGACVEWLQEGAACKAAATSAPCDLTKALFCLKDVCTKAVISHVATGEKCGAIAVAPFAVALCSNGDCEQDKCVAHVADGTTCTVDTDNCQEPAKCRGGKCALKDPLLCK